MEEIGDGKETQDVKEKNVRRGTTSFLTLRTSHPFRLSPGLLTKPTLPEGTEVGKRFGKSRGRGKIG